MRSTRFMFVLFTCLFLSFSAKAKAQSILEVMPASGVIVSLDSIKYPRNGPDCGAYFRFTGAPKEPGKYGVVTFMYADKNHMGIPLMASDKLEIHVVAGKKVPTAKVIRDGGPVYPWFAIELSPLDSAKAPCLLYSKFVRAVTRPSA